MSIESGLEAIKDAETIRKEFADQLYDWMGGLHQWKQKYGKYSGQEFYQTALVSLKTKHRLKEDVAASLLDQSAAEELDAEIDRCLKDLNNQALQRNMYFALVNNVQEYFKKLKGYEFVSTSPSGLSSLISGGLTGMARPRLAKLEERLNKAKEDLEAAKKPAETPTKTIDRKRHVLRAQLKLSIDLYTEFKEIGEETDAAVNKAAAMVNEQAIYNWIAIQKDDEKRKFVKNVSTGATFVTDVGGTFAPPGHKWIAGLVDFVIEAGGRSADEILIMQKVDKYRKDNSPGSIFAEFSKDPTIMAKGLARTVKENVKLLLAGIGIFGSEIPGWPYIQKVVKSVISEWMDRRVEEARKLLPDEKLTPEEIEEFDKDRERREKAGKGFEGKCKLALETFRANAQEDLTDALLDKLKEGDTWGEAIKFLKEEGEEAAKTAKEFGQNLGAVLVEPIVKRVMKVIPISPAQLVSGDDLTALVNEALTSIGIPQGWGKVSVATGAGQVRKEHKKDELFRNKYGWTIRGSNVLRDKKDEDDEVIEQWVAFRRFGSLVWGYLDNAGEFTVETAEIVDAPWGDRSVTNDGYTVTGQPEKNETGGKWFTIKDPKLKGYFLFNKANGSYEWLRTFTMTKLGRAEDVVRPAGDLSIFD